MQKLIKVSLIVAIGFLMPIFSFGQARVTPMQFDQSTLNAFYEKYGEANEAVNQPQPYGSVESLSENIVAPAAGIVFDIWYGDEQDFGTNGTPQHWINLLGNVSDAGSGINSLTFTINGGASRNLSVGKDGRRLVGKGDFNVEMDIGDLNNGANTIVLTATNGNNETTTKTVTLNYDKNSYWPLPYSVDFSQVDKISDVAQIVDGKWELVEDGVRNTQVGYDRVIAFGQRDWTEYEVEARVTIDAIDTRGYNDAKGGNVLSMSLAMRIDGHTNDPVVCPQPHCGWNPMGASNWYMWTPQGPDQITISEAGPPYDPVGVIGLQLEVGHTYWYKTRVEDTPNRAKGGSLFSFKIWEAGTQEPANWTIQKQANNGTVLKGGFSLAPHYTTVTIHEVHAVPINGAGPTAPAITSTATTTVLNGDVYAYDVNATGDPTPSYSLTTAPAGMTINASTGEIDWTPLVNGDFAVTVEATNSEGSDTQSFTIQVQEIPLFTSTANTGGTIGAAYSYDADATGFPTPTYSLTTSPAGMTINATSGVIDWTPNNGGTFPVTVVATNVAGSANQNYSVSVDGPPVIISTAVLAGNVGGAYSYDVNADGFPAPTYSLTTSPAGMTINATSGVISWTPSAMGDYPVTVVATNSAGSDPQSFTINVQEAPVFTSTPISVATLGTPYIYDADADGNPTPTYSLGNAPAGMTINATSGVIDWTPTSGVNIPVQVIATNSAGSSTQDYTISVNEAPAIISAAFTSGNVGSAYNYDVDASGFPAPTFSLTTSPAGMTINTTSGVISWIPDVAGDNPVTVLATNATGSDNQSFTVSVTETVGRVSADLQVLYDFSEGTGTTVNDISGVGSPMNLNINKSGSVNWLPDGGLDVTASVLISTGNTSKLRTAVVNANAMTVEAWIKPSSTTQSGPARLVTYSKSGSQRNFTLGQNGSEWQMRLRTTDTNNNGLPIVQTSNSDVSADLQHVVYTRDASGAVAIYVDNVLVTNASTIGNLSNWDAASSYKFALANEANQSRAWTGEYHLVAVYSRALTAGEVTQNFSAGGGSTTPPVAPAITSTPVILASIGNAYSYDVNASGSPNPTYSLTVSPAGMTIDANSGVISWTPGSGGTFDVTVAASNAGGSDTQSYQIDVTGVPAITSTAITSAAQNEAYSYDVDATGFPTPTYALTVSPAGMTIDANSGVISWTPTAGGTFDVTVQASNSAGTDNQVYQIAVSAPTPPVITSTAVTSASVGSAYSYDVDASGTPAPTYALTVSPAGMSIDANSGLILWTPDTEGDFNVTVTATNSAGSDPQSFVISATAVTGRVVAGLTALYTFEEGSGNSVTDVSGVGSAVNLTINKTGSVTWIPGGGLSVDNSVLIKNNNAGKISTSLTASNALSIEAWVVPANATQNGPARLVSYSRSNSQRNFTLEQVAADWKMRLRASSTNNNGLPAVQTSNGSVNVALQHVVYTRDASGNANLYVDDVLETSSTVTGTFSNWSSASSYKFALANEMNQSKPWRGEMHLVAIYDRALTAGEVSQNFSSGTHGSALAFASRAAVRAEAIADQAEIAAIEALPEMPNGYYISEAYPNPFNPQTTFQVAIKEAQNVSVAVYNVIGQRVALIQQGVLSGNQLHTFNFDGSNLTSGLYIIRVAGEQFAVVKKVMLVK